MNEDTNNDGQTPNDSVESKSERVPFDFEKWMAEENLRKEDNKSKLKTYVLAMKDAGATGVIEVTFDGYGDSGEVTPPDLSAEQNEITHKLGYKFDYPETTRTYNIATQSWETIGTCDYIPLLGIISDVIPFDWYNNDGGFGTVYLDIDAGTVHIDGNIRIQSTESVEDSF